MVALCLVNITILPLFSNSLHLALHAASAGECALPEAT
jgi:hypothetical protein